MEALPVTAVSHVNSIVSSSSPRRSYSISTVCERWNIHTLARDPDFKRSAHAEVRQVRFIHSPNVDVTSSVSRYSVTSFSLPS